MRPCNRHQHQTFAYIEQDGSEHLDICLIPFQQAHCLTDHLDFEDKNCVASHITEGILEDSGLCGMPLQNFLAHFPRNYLHYISNRPRSPL